MYINSRIIVLSLSPPFSLARLLQIRKKILLTNMYDKGLRQQNVLR